MQHLLSLLFLLVTAAADPAIDKSVQSSSILTSTTTAANSEPTVPYASDDPNYTLNGTAEAVRGSLGSTILGPNNIPVVIENPNLLAPPTTDKGTV